MVFKLAYVEFLDVLLSMLIALTRYSGLEVLLIDSYYVANITLVSSLARRAKLLQMI